MIALPFIPIFRGAGFLPHVREAIRHQSCKASKNTVNFVFNRRLVT